MVDDWKRERKPMSDELSWEAQEVLKAIKSFDRMPAVGIPFNELVMKVAKPKL